MTKKETSKERKGETVFDLVRNWIELDDSDDIEEAVRRWTGSKSFQKELLKVPT